MRNLTYPVRRGTVGFLTLKVRVAHLVGRQPSVVDDYGAPGALGRADVERIVNREIGR